MGMPWRTAPCAVESAEHEQFARVVLTLLPNAAATCTCSVSATSRAPRPGSCARGNMRDTRPGSGSPVQRTIVRYGYAVLVVVAALVAATALRTFDLEVTVSVRDGGVGFDVARMERLFEAFYTTKPHGMGMGLAISRSIIEMHGGRLWAEPNDGVGATFSFSVPAGEGVRP
jgi:signal transduction histidine kinase